MDKLRDRVAANTRSSNGTGKEVEKATLAQQVEQWQQEFQLAMPQGSEARQLVRDALHLMRTTKHLAQCEPAGVLGGLMTFAQLGLRPGVLGHGWLLPFKKRALVNGQWTDVYQAQIVIGYKGYVELVHRSPMVSGISGSAVFERDEFSEELGSEPKIVHKPYRGPGGRGKVIGYYAVIRYHSGLPTFAYMSREEAIEWRNHFAMGVKRDRKTKQPIVNEDGEVQGDGPWFEMDNGPEGASGFDQMAIKTCFLQAQKWAPKGTDQTLARAMEVDGAVRISADPTNPDEMLTAEHPDPRVIDAEADIEDEQPLPGAPPVTEVGKPAGSERPAAAEKPAPSTAELVTEFPQVPGDPEKDKPALQSQLTKIHALIDGVAKLDDGQRHALLGHLIGLPRPVKSASELTRREAGQIQHYLEEWRDGDRLGDQVSAVLAAALGGPEEPSGESEVPPSG